MAAVPNIQLQHPAVAAEPPRASSSLSIKIWKAVSMIFEVLANVGAVIVFAAAITTNLSGWHVLTALALSFAANRANMAREKMHDFANPEELRRLRASAPHMSYPELRRAFKLADIKQYDLVPIDGLRHKVLLFLATPANFQYYMKGVFGFGAGEVNRLLEHGIIDVDIASAIRGGNQGQIQQLLN